MITVTVSIIIAILGIILGIINFTHGIISNNRTTDSIVLGHVISIFTMITGTTIAIVKFLLVAWPVIFGV